VLGGPCQLGFMSSKPTVADMMTAYAQDAVDHARANGVALDYSLDSAKQVEKLLATLYAAIPRGTLSRIFKRGPSDEDITAMSKMYGGYVGEVIRRARGGEWTFDKEISPGHTVISLRDGDKSIFPPAKVYKRLVNGAEDNVADYVQVLVDELWK
jgi:hypothetical protein